MSDLILDAIEHQIQNHRVILYMKGTPFHPQCGFSAKAASILGQRQLNFAFVDVLANPEIRQWLPEHSGWPTFPQLFIDQELIGGCDILCEIEKNGELAKIIADQKLEQNKIITDAMEALS